MKAGMPRPSAGRIEAKHCVSADVADAVLRIARVFLESDRGVAGAERQQITSLYLDTPRLAFFRNHVEGAPDRFKLRVRAYGMPPYRDVYAEVKRKVGLVGRKHRARVPADALRELVTGAGTVLSEGMASGQRDNLQEFVCRRLTYAAAPRVLTRAVRESLRDQANGDTAVTVDRALSFQVARTPELDPHPAGWRRIDLPPGTACIVELKHGARTPRWMTALLTQLAGSRVSFSKYVSAIRQADPWETC